MVAEADGEQRWRSEKKEEQTRVPKHLREMVEGDLKKESF